MRHSKPVRLETAPTGEAKVSIYFSEFTIKRPKQQIMSQLAAEHSLQPIDDYFFLAFV